jgi:hypothetical protein
LTHIRHKRIAWWLLSVGIIVPVALTLTLF